MAETIASVDRSDFAVISLQGLVVSYTWWGTCSIDCRPGTVAHGTRRLARYGLPGNV